MVRIFLESTLCGESENYNFHPDESLHIWSEPCNSFWFPVAEWRELTFSRLQRDLDPGDLFPASYPMVNGWDG